MDEIKTPETNMDAAEQKSVAPDKKSTEEKEVATQEAKNTPDKVNEVSLDEDDNAETKKVTGGSYKDVKKDVEDGQKTEVHHMPADSVNGLEYNDGPAIAMDKADHRETASCGNSKEAQEYRAAQSELVKDGKFNEAMQMDIDDIHEKFGDKYDDSIAEMKTYADKLESGD